MKSIRTANSIWLSIAILIFLEAPFIPGLASWEQQVMYSGLRKQKTSKQYEQPQTRPSTGNFTNLSSWIHDIVRGEIPKNVFFQHFRKAGGTSFCKMARENMLASPNNNCNLPKEDQILWQSDPTIQRSIPSRFPQWNFFAHEGPMADDVAFLSDFFAVTILREPAARAKSSYYMRLRQMDKHGEDPTLGFEAWSKRLVLSNFYVRWLNGVSVSRNVKDLTVKHLNIAKDRLDHFPLVWLTEWYFLLGSITHTLLGWQSTESKKKHQHPKIQDQENDPYKNVSNLNLIYANNELDIQLYRHGINRAVSTLLQLLESFPDFCTDFRERDYLKQMIASDVPLSERDQQKIHSVLQASCIDT